MIYFYELHIEGSEGYAEAARIAVPEVIYHVHSDLMNNHVHLLLQSLDWNIMAKGMQGIKRQAWRDDSSKAREKVERELREQFAQDGEGLENSWDINEIIQ